jgi:hypothetical protein
LLLQYELVLGFSLKIVSEREVLRQLLEEYLLLFEFLWLLITLLKRQLGNEYWIISRHFGELENYLGVMLLLTHYL